MGAFIENPKSIIDVATDLLAFDNGTVIEVWDVEGEHHFGNLPRHFGAEHIKEAVRFYVLGQDCGRVLGVTEAQFTMRRALGL